MLANLSDSWKISDSMQFEKILGANLKNSLEIRFHDIYQKNVFGQIAKMLYDNLKDDFPTLEFGAKLPLLNDKNTECIIWYGMAHSGIVEFKVALSKGVIIGVQIEGNQYRHFIEKSSKCRDLAIELEKAQKWFVLSDFPNNEIMPKSKTGNVEFNTYKDRQKQESFKYRYVKIGPKDIGNIIKQMCSDFQKAMNLRNDEEVQKLIKSVD